MAPSVPRHTRSVVYAVTMSLDCWEPDVIGLVVQSWLRSPHTTGRRSLSFLCRYAHRAISRWSYRKSPIIPATPIESSDITNALSAARPKRSRTGFSALRRQCFALSTVTGELYPIRCDATEEADAIVQASRRLISFAYSYAFHVTAFFTTDEDRPADVLIALGREVVCHASAKYHRVELSQSVHAGLVVNVRTVGFNNNEEVPHPR